MKFLISVFGAMALLLAGCSKDNSTADEEVSLLVDPVNVELLGGGESKVVTVTTNATEWSAIRPEADSWCTLTTEGNKLTITAAPSISEKKRTTRITVSAPNAKDCFIEVSQNAIAFPGLPNIVELAASGKEQMFTILTTRTLTILEQPASWCTVEKDGNAVYFSAQKNEGDERETSVKISDGTESVVVIIKQNLKTEAEYAVGDLFREDNKVTGIVAYVDEDDGFALVLALDEISPSTDPLAPSSVWAFSFEAKDQFSTTENDGQANIEIWRNKFNSSNRYKAFYVCEQLNKNGAKDWFLPSRDELKLISTGIATLGVMNFNAKFADISGSVPVGTYFYWSSTEAQHSYAVTVCLANGVVSSQFKADDEVVATRAARKI